MEYKPVKFRLSSWKRLRRQFYGRKNENFSDYLERIVKKLEPVSKRAATELLKSLSLSDNQKLNNEEERANEKKFRNTRL